MNPKDEDLDIDIDSEFEDIEELPGMTLRMARFKLERSVSDISNRTRVQERFIDALEDDDYTQFWSVVYAIGFLRAYCREIGVDHRPFEKSVRKTFYRQQVHVK